MISNEFIRTEMTTEQINRQMQLYNDTLSSTEEINTDNCIRSIYQLNSEIRAYNETFTNTLAIAQLAMAIIAAVGFGFLIGFSLIATAPYLTIPCIALTVMGGGGLAFRAFIAYFINKKIEVIKGFFEANSATYLTREMGSEKDGEFSESEFLRMKPYLPVGGSETGFIDTVLKIHQVTYSLQPVQFANFFSATPINYERSRVQVGSIREALQARHCPWRMKYSSWRKLLREMTTPANEGRFDERLLKLIGAMTTDDHTEIERYNRELRRESILGHSYQIIYESRDPHTPRRIVSVPMPEGCDGYEDAEAFKDRHLQVECGLQFAS